MGTDANQEFEGLMGQLEDWYADSVRAMTYDGGSGTHEAGHAILLRNRYPGPPWRARWRFAGPIERIDILRALTEELYGLAHGPSQSSPASGLHRGTKEWRAAVAREDGSLRAIARRFGVSHEQVRLLRLQHGGQHA